MALRYTLILAITLCLASIASVRADNPYITVASTTSTQNSGLFDYILPIFTKQSGIEVRVVAVGTGQAIKLAANGDADVLFVHHRQSEEKFIAEGSGVKRYDVMYNDFVLVGPKSDPAHISGMADVTAALGQAAEMKSVFVSRGDDSGTNKKELDLWKKANVDIKAASGTWYRESGSGMGATLNTASSMEGYTLTDRGTWLSFKNPGTLVIVSQGDKLLFNPYGVMLVNPEKHPQTKVAEGQAFIDWLVSPEGQAAIADYKIDGQQLFFPNASGN
ncbi:MAG: extracellular solute-binding protein [Rhodospirillales bacterium]|nr:extracellular solute-binding protein [Rhodospirillales bacterium]